MDYAYKALDRHGRIVRGTMQASSLSDLDARLQRINLDFLNGRALRRGTFFAYRPSARERIHFCFHLEQLTRAGIPLVDALTDLPSPTERPQFKQMVGQIIDSMEGGQTLSEAMAAHPRAFDPVFCTLVRAGEQSGKLPDVFSELAESAKRADELASHMRRLFIYPTFVASATLGAVLVAMIYVVPELMRLFHATGQTLPIQTLVLVAVSNLIVHHGLLMLAIVIAAIGMTAAAVKVSTAAAHRWDALKFVAPIFGPVYHKIVVARFCSLFAMMYGAGITVIEIMDTARDVAGNVAMRQALTNAQSLIREGQGISAALSRTRLFPPLVLHMFRIGENTGSLDVALRNVGYFYDRDVREAIIRAQAALEPAMITVLGAVMMWIALAILGPIYDIIAKMGQ